MTQVRPVIAEELLALAAKVEAATGADLELDCLIAEALGWQAHVFGQAGRVWLNPEGKRQAMPPEFTGSFDAALTLLDQWDEHPEWQVTRRYCTGYHASIGMGDDGIGCETPALALTAACLKARALSTLTPDKGE